MRARAALLLIALCAGMSAAEPSEASVAGVAYLYAAHPAEQPAPLLLVVPGADSRAAWRQWEPAASGQGWSLAVAPVAQGGDAGMKALEAVAADAANRVRADANRIYLAGQGSGATLALYAAVRRADLWAGVLAAGGSARPAIDSNRLFAANTQLVPVLWLAPPEEETLKARLSDAGYHFERAPSGQFTVAQVLAWFAGQRREPFPQKVDYETGSPEFARCSWVEIARFDPTRRNDVLASSRINPGTGASLALGGFGFDPAAPGPGVLVGWLPPSYRGPLNLEDRIVAVAGKEIRDGRHYGEFMDQVADEQRVAVMVLRGKQRVRIETRIVVRQREENETARVQAEFLSDSRQMQVISRGAAALRLTLPQYWVPTAINWNGFEAGKADAPGCWLLAEGKPAQRCPAP